MDKTKLFLDDCIGLLIKIRTSMAALRRGQGDTKAILDTMIRDLHSIKGITSMMAYNDVAVFAYAWEDAVKLCSDGTIPLTKEVLAIFSDCYDVLADMTYGIIGSILCNFMADTDKNEQRRAHVTKSLDEIKKKKTPKEASPRAAAPPRYADPPADHFLYRLEVPLKEVNFEKFAGFMSDLNTMGTVYSITPEVLSIVAGTDDVIALLFRTHKTQQELAHAISGYEMALKITDISRRLSTEETPFLDELYFFFYALEKERNITTFKNKFKSDRELSINTLIEDLKSGIINEAQQLGKKLEIEIDDKQVLIDKSIVELLRETLLLLLRNALTHGIETPEERKKQGKADYGKIWIKKYFEGPLIVVEIGDDGRGIDVKKIKEKSAEALKWSLSEDSDKKVLSLLFNEGVSTLDKADIMAGRGVGLTRVKENIEKLGGNVIVLTKKGKGTRFFIKFPQNSMLVKGVRVELQMRQYLVPFFYLKMPYSPDGKKITVLGKTIPVDRIIGEDEIGIVPSDMSILNVANDSIPIVKIRQAKKTGPAQ